MSILELIVSLNALTKTFPSSIASPAAKFSDEAIDFTDHRDLQELYEII